jgi:hypothetical protein
MDPTAWNEIVLALGERDVPTCVDAATRLHAEADINDVPRLKELLQNESFFVREAAAWPLAELAGPSALPELFAAYQRGFGEGHDNDGFTAALLEIPALHRTETKPALLLLMGFGGDKIREHAEWLLEFCEDGTA